MQSLTTPLQSNQLETTDTHMKELENLQANEAILTQTSTYEATLKREIPSVFSDAVAARSDII